VHYNTHTGAYSDSHWQKIKAPSSHVPKGNDLIDKLLKRLKTRFLPI